MFFFFAEVKVKEEYIKWSVSESELVLYALIVKV
jgi:hypothetical protein